MLRGGDCDYSSLAIENYLRHCPAAYFCTMTSNDSVLSMELKSYHLLAPGIFRWLLRFLKIFAPLDLLTS